MNKYIQNGIETTCKQNILKKSNETNIILYFQRKMICPKKKLDSV